MILYPIDFTKLYAYYGVRDTIMDGEIPKTSNSTFGNCPGEGKQLSYLVNTQLMQFVFKCYEYNCIAS